MLLFLIDKNMRAKLNLLRVGIEQFDADTLREAARQGRLYLAPAEVSEEQRQADILRYVARIDSCAAPPYTESISRLWKAIIAHTAFADCWHIRRGKRKGQVNRSFVTNIVALLHDRGVYQAASTTHLHFLLEDVTQRNVVYTNIVQYRTTRVQQDTIKKLIHDFRGDM